jgi:short-subunit dehydrogenase
MPTAANTNSGTILITGASSGIGRATALALDRAGYRVMAGVRRLEDGVPLKADAGSMLETIVLDVTVKEDIEAARAHIETVTAGHGLFALINNAGFNYNAAYEYTDEAKARALMEVNLFGAHAMSVAMLPLLRQSVRSSGQTSKLINIGSIGSLVGIPWEAFYHASKFALLGLSESIRNEVYAQGIRVSVVMPGGIKTAFIAKTKVGSQQAIEAMPPEGAQRYARGLSRMSELTSMVDRFGSSPEKVGQRIVRLLEQRNPPFRALVGLDAHLMNGLSATLPTPMFHAILRRQFAC